MTGMGLLLFFGDGYFDHSVQAVLEDAVGFPDTVEREAVGDERRGVYPSFGYQAENFRTVASVHSAGLEGQVLAIHVGQGQHLRPVVQGHDGDHRIGAGALPGQAERIVGSGHFEHHVGPAVRTMSEHLLPARLGQNDEHVGIMFAHEAGAFFRLLADDDLPRPFQQHAQQGTDARGACSDDEHRVVRPDVRDAGGPEAGGQDVAHEEGLLVADAVGDAVQSLVGMGHTHVLGLSAVDAAAQRPASVGVFAVVHIAVTAEETLAAEGFDVHRHPVAGLYGSDALAHPFDNAHHLVADGNAGHGTGHAAVLDVQVARTDAAQRDAHQGVMRVFQLGHGLLPQFEAPVLHVSICQHILSMI